jgi:hypothetical protein
MKRTMAEQGCQADQIAGVVRQIPASKGVPQGMRVRLFWHQMASRFHQVRDYLFREDSELKWCL